METLIMLKDVLNNVNDFEWSYALYLPEDEVWELQTKCAVLDPDDLDDDNEDVPKFAVENNLIYALNIQDIQGIVKNAHDQKLNCSENDLLEAFLYYYDNDAFMKFTE